MKRLLFLAVPFALLLWVLTLSAPRTAAAHPMGNFSINQYSAVTVSDGRVSIFYVLDMAEIPAIQELASIRPDRSTELTPEQRQGYTTRKSAELMPGFSLSVNGKPAQL